MERRARWIWRDRGVGPRPRVDPKLDANLFVMFRRSIALATVPARASLRVSADGRYRLYVSGIHVGRGPARCEPLFQYYDVYDIAPHLRPGENTIAVLAHSYGRDMSWYELPRTHWADALGCGGVFVECDAIPDIDSSTAWRYRLADAWERDAAPGSVGFAEVYDARNALDGWTQPAFDDSEWDQAVALATPGIGIAPPTVPFPHMVERDIPPLLEEHRDPVRIVSMREIDAADHDMLVLAEAKPEPLVACRIESPEAMLSSSEDDAIVHLAPGRAVTAVIDFGRDVTGYPRLVVDGPAGATIDVSYSERLRDDGRTPVQRPNPITGQNVHRYILRNGEQSWEKFERAGFRYLQLTVSPSPGAPDEPVCIRHANINFTSYPVGQRGRFACSDETLTRIWRAGAYTLQLCMEDGFEDCPSREQRQWVGDAYVEAMVNYACFGDTKLTAKFLRQVAQSQRRDGMTQMCTPTDVSARWPLFIVDFCLWWVRNAGEYVLHTGDESVIDDIFPSVARAVAWFERHIGRDGLLVDPPGWIFVDWAEVDKRGASCAVNAMLAQALGYAAAIAESQGAEKLASRWRALAGRIGVALNADLWDEARGVYVDALVAGRRSNRVSQQSNAAIIAAGIAPRDRWDRMLDYIMDEKRLVATGTSMAPSSIPFDEATQVVLAQPFYMHNVHRALAAAGRHDAIAASIRQRWSPMLAQEPDETDTMWEHWHGEDSRCHAWSATPTYDLSREVLGVRPLAPGFARFAIEPHPSGLTWADGVYPSVKGDIKVSWKIEDGQFSLTCTVPEGAEAVLTLPGDSRVTAPPAIWGPGDHAMAPVFMYDAASSSS